jgi:CBS domain-containing protein
MLYASGIMTREVVTAHPTDTVANVAHLLAKNAISAVPVCDADGTVLGMVSEGDLIRPFIESNVKRRAWWLTLLADGTDLAPEFLEHVRLDRHEVGDLMTRAVISAPSSASITELAELMTRHHIKRVPIIHEGKLVGIVSRADVIRAIAQSPESVIEAA